MGVVTQCIAYIEVVTGHRMVDVEPGHSPINRNNLVLIPQIGNKHSKQLKFGLLNVRSIGDDTTSGQIHDFVTTEDFDCLALTEMWLCPDDRSQQQIDRRSEEGGPIH